MQRFSNSMLFPIFVLSARRRDQQHVSPHLRLYHEPHLTPPSPVYVPPLVYIPKQLSDPARNPTDKSPDAENPR
jgi:hypothetical protein